MKPTPKNPAAVALGKLGGSVKSAAKARASRANGKLGGRPKNVAEVVKSKRPGWSLAVMGEESK